MIDESLHNKLRSEYNPDGSMLRTVQLNLLDILIEFDRICRKHHIDYWLEYGTLLGAERHGGFIPWDDDLDVSILKKDKKRLERAIKEELKEPFVYLDSGSGYARRWSRVANRTITVSRAAGSTGPHGITTEKEENIWLDIFFSVNGSPSVSKRIDVFFGRCFRRRYKLVNDGWIKHIAGTLLYPFAQLTVLTARLWGAVFKKRQLIDDFGTGIYYISKEVRDIFPLKETVFEGHKFSAPHDSDHYLRKIYGNWTELPERIANHSIQVINIQSK